MKAPYMVDKDFSRVHFKVNSSGSWANLLTCQASKYEEVKQACEQLAKAAGSSVRFKAVDADGGVIELYSPIPPNGSCAWHEPRLH